MGTAGLLGVACYSQPEGELPERVEEGGEGARWEGKTLRWLLQLLRFPFYFINSL